MQATIAQHLSNIGAGTDRQAVRSVVEPIADRVSTMSLTTAGLVIKAGASALAKTGAAAYYGSVKGKLLTVAAATDMAALSGTVANAAFNIYVFFIDAAGTLTTTMGIEGATLAAVKFPPIPEGKAMIGFVVINPTGTGDFVGGTTALDDGTVTPNAAYVNVVGAFDPTVLI